MRAAERERGVRPEGLLRITRYCVRGNAARPAFLPPEAINKFCSARPRRSVSDGVGGHPLVFGTSDWLAADSPEGDHSLSSDSDHHSPVIDQRGRSEATLAFAFCPTVIGMARETGRFSAIRDPERSAGRPVLQPGWVLFYARTGLNCKPCVRSGPLAKRLPINMMR